MFKKILLAIAILLVIILSGWKLFFSKSDVSKKMDKLKKDLTSYHIEANMDLLSNDETRSYYIVTDYQKNNEQDYFRVSMLDKNINQTQIMLKNNDGVFVLTPALNQVYKFKGTWPLNSPKPYLYHSLISLFDEEHQIKKNENGYLIMGKASYPNSPNWVNQEVQFSEDLKPISVNILDASSTSVGKITFTEVDFKPTYSEDFFSVDSNMNRAREKLPKSETSVTFDDLPLLPVDNSSTLKEKTISAIDGENYYILSFEGKNNFTMVQGIAQPNETMKVVELDMDYVETINGIAFVKDNHLIYQNNCVSYEIYSDTMDIYKIIDVVNSLEVYEKK